MANSMSLLELFAHLENRLDVKLAYRRLPWRHSDQKFFVANNSLARRLLSWTPRTTRKDGIEDTLAWESTRLNV
jgi:CDP-paratose 2-epimerase